jgi:hypothetical protein
MGLLAQKNASIGNLEIVDIDRKFYIHYDILNSHADSTHIIELYVIDNIGRVVVPDSVSGDVGQGVPGSPDRQIIWDIYSEYDVVHGHFDPRIRIDGREGYTVKGGPWNALLSVPVPGLGDYFVENYDKIRIKPWMRTAGAYGLVGLGLIAGHNRTWTPPTWVEGHEKIGWHLEGHNYVLGPYWVEGHYADNGHYNYWLFKWDKEVFLTAGIAIWAADIIWVYVKGRRNRILGEKLNTRFDVSLIQNEPTLNLTLTYTFN